MARIAVVGPGAIGGTIAAELSRGGVHELVVCARTPFERLEVETPTGPLVATPRVLLDPAEASPVDWVLVATKAYDHAATALWLKPLFGEGTRIAILQNGVEHVARFSPYVPASSLLPVVVSCPAGRSAPGRIRLRRQAALRVPDTADGRAFAALFSRSEVVVTTVADFMSELWRKLCLNCAGAVSAILMQPAAPSKRAGIAQLMRDLASECRAVANAEGASLGDDAVDDAVASYLRGAPDAINSLHADRLAGRPMEIDARNGVVVRLGAKHGIPTPLNKAVVALLEAVSA